MAMIGAATLKKKGYKPSDPDVFLGSSLRSSFGHLGLCSRAGEKEGEALGIFA